MKQIKLISFTFGLLLLLNLQAHAANWYVSPTGTGSGGSPNDPTGIYSALAQANSGDRILLDSGIYNLSSTLTVDKSLLIETNSSNTSPTILNCTATNCFDLNFSNSSERLILKNFELSGGHIQIASTYTTSARFSELSIENMIFSNFSGYALYKGSYHDLSVSIQRSKFINSSANSNMATIKFFEGNNSSTNTLYVNDSEFFNQSSNGNSHIDLCQLSPRPGYDYDVSLENNFFTGPGTIGVSTCTGSSQLNLFLDANTFINLDTGVLVTSDSLSSTYSDYTIYAHGNKFLSSSNGIRVDEHIEDSYVTIENNSFFNISNTAFTSGGNHRNRITKNRFFNTSIGVNLIFDNEFFDIANLDNGACVIENNLFEKGNHALVLDNSVAEFRYNNVVRFSSAGISSQYSINTRLTNSVYANVFYRNGTGISHYSYDSARNMMVYGKNIFYRNGTGVYGNGFVASAVNLTMDPRFAISGSYSTVYSGSPLINGTTWNSLVDDLDNNPRSSGADIGCYEVNVIQP